MLNGEDPRVPAALEALHLPDPASRARRLGQLGIGLVVREHGVATTPEYDAPVAGTTVHAGPELDVVRIDAPVRLREIPASWKAAVGFAWTAFALLPVAGLSTAGWRRWRRKAGSRPPG
ncbi:hypothetical protein [Nocardioides ungokensis]|uniref:hypothetical protein n=1 Tax=Nocardioides ungokensis TaxID=1643322 RepID=UPI0015DFEE49|nr:hypothetical protein [Nocardioides ungokensis]